MIKIEENSIIKQIMPYLPKEKVYVVGGYLRDILLGKKSDDIDIVVPQGLAKQTGMLIAEKLEGHFVPLDELNQIYRVVLSDKKTYIDIADIEGLDIKEDLKRRDFTINALGYDIYKNELVDICDSYNDLKNGIIQEISEKNIIDDPIRILRAYRFKSTLSFDLSENLTNIIKKHADLLKCPAAERINQELFKLFDGDNLVLTLIELAKSGLLELIFPEIKEIKKVPPNAHHHLDLLNHSFETVKHVSEYYKNSCEDVKKHLDTCAFGGYRRLVYLRIAAFLHDAGKPSTRTIDKDTGRERFIKHDDVGAKIIVPTLKKLKFSNKQILYIQKLIKYHIYPASVVTAENVTEKAMFRFIRKMEDEVIDLIALAYADRLSARGEAITQEIIDKNINGLQKLLDLYLENIDKIEPLPKLLNGNEIMNILNINAGPKLGIIMEKLHEAQISSDVLTKEDAIEFIKKEGNFSG